MRIGILSILLIVSLHTNAQFVEAPKHEYRAVWLTTIKGLDWPREEHRGNDVAQRAHLCTLLDSLQAIHINTVLLQTRIRGDVIYPSAIEPFAPVFTGKHGIAPSYDPLAFAIEECHQRGMQLHAWLVTIPLGDANYVSSHGKKSLPAKKRGQCTRFKGAWYMEPSHPATTEHLCALAEEIVTRYDVDGIHFDYIRYPEGNSNYPDGAIYSKTKQWRQSKEDWRRLKITHLMSALYAKVKSIKPWVCVSAATLGKHDDTSRYSSYGWNAYHTVHQEAQEWLRRGIADALFPMVYYADNHFYPFVCDWGEHCYGRHIVVGMGTYQLHPDEKDWAIEEAIRQHQMTRMHPNIAGAAQFRSLFVTNNTKGIYDWLNHIYPYPALVPSIPWMKSTPPPMPQLFEVEAGKYTTRLSWERCDTLQYNIYSSDSFPVDTDNPANLCRTYLRDSCYTLPTPSIVQPRHYAITSIDRYGNESVPAQWKGEIVLRVPKDSRPKPKRQEH